MLRAALALLMVVALLGLTMGVDAQEKKDIKDLKKIDIKDIKKVDPKDTKKVDPKEAKKDAVSGGIEIYKGKNGFRYRIVDAEGKTIAMPIANKAWDSKEDVIKALDTLKEILNKAKPVDSKD